jgi:hypothetical protein
MGVKRAEAARILNVSKARITQLVKLGMPSLPDGGIDIAEARAWMAANLDPAKRAGWAAAKIQRAPPAQGPRADRLVPVHRFEEPRHIGFATAASLAVQSVAFHAARAGAVAGVTRDQAEKIAEATMTAVWAEMEDMAKQIGMQAAGPEGDVLRLDEVWSRPWQSWFPWPEMFDAQGASIVTGGALDG